MLSVDTVLYEYEIIIYDTLLIYNFWLEEYEKAKKHGIGRSGEVGSLLLLQSVYYHKKPQKPELKKQLFLKKTIIIKQKKL